MAIFKSTSHFFVRGSTQPSSPRRSKLGRTRQPALPLQKYISRPRPLRKLSNNSNAFTRPIQRSPAKATCHGRIIKPAPSLELRSVPNGDPMPSSGAGMHPGDLPAPHLGSRGRGMKHMPLIPLAVAQRRVDIRSRVEGFEMQGNAPLGTSVLLSLAEAQARDDIKRRGEAFELKNQTSAQVPREVPSPRIESVTLSKSTTSLSVSSLGSWFEIGFADWECPLDDSYVLEAALSDSVIYDFSREVRGSLSGRSETPSAREVVDFTSSSIDEESLLRMAETELGW